MISLKSFEDSDRVKAQDCRLELESEATIRMTHGRYFYDLSELIARFQEALEAA